MAIRYYTEEISKVPYPALRDALARQCGPLGAPLAFGLRLMGRLGWRLPTSYGTGFVGTAEPIDPSELPAGAASKWAPLLEQLADLGFEPLRVERAVTIGMKRNYCATLYDPRRHCVAILEWVCMQGGSGVEENAPLELDSYGGSGPDVLTGGVRKADLALAGMYPFDDVEIENHDIRRPVAELVARHCDRCRGRDMIPLHQRNVLSLVDDRAHKRFDALMEWGLIRELAPQEIERLQAMDAGVLYQ